MGRIILIILLFISFVSLGQTNSAKYVRDADTAQMIIQTTKSGGIVKYLLITGTDTAQIRWDGTALLIEGYNIVDSTNLQTDTLQALRIDINKNIDSLALHLDTLQVHNIRINNNVDSLGVHLDTLQVHRTDINAKVDSTNIRLYNTGNSVFIGGGAGENDDLSDNDNVFIGYQSGLNTTIATNDVAIGYQSLYTNIIGFWNTTVGAYSLYNNTNNWNTAVGAYSLYGNIGGTNNSALGKEAGRYVFGGGENETGTSSIFIGALSIAGGVGQSNQIVIGANAIGNGPDTFTAGDDNVTDVYMNEDGTAIVHAGEYILGTDYKIIIFNDTMCGVKISTTDTVRIVPTR